MTDSDRGLGPAGGPTAQATFCATLADEWVRTGVTDAVVCPGSRSTPLALALAERAERGDLALHVHHDERSGSFLALGLAGATRRPVVVLTTSGTATVQLHAAVVEADLSGVPLIVCTADRPPELRGVAAPQTVDQERLYGRSTRWYCDPGIADPAVAHTWRSLAARAVAEATAPWPGPVQLNLPFREPLVGGPGPVPAARASGPWHHRAAAPRAAPLLDPALAGAPGIVVAGRGVSELDRDGVGALADELGWPVLADPLSGCRTPGTIAAFDPLLRTPVAERLRPQVVLRVGGLPASRVLAEWLAALGAVELVVAPAPWFPDPNHTAALLLDALPAAPPGPRAPASWRSGWQAAEAAAQAALDEELTSLSEPAIARHLVRTARPGSALALSSSMPVRDVEWFAPGRADVRVLANRGANGIDGVVSTAVGVALSGVRTTLLIGDVAFLHDVNGLLGLADRRVDLTVVVVDNDGGGIFSFLPQAQQLPTDRYEQLFGTPHGLDLAAVAEAHGVEARRVTSLDDLVFEPGVRVLVAATDRADNVVVHERANAAVAAAVEDLPN